jgi:hypothetical protein
MKDGMTLAGGHYAECGMKRRTSARPLMADELQAAGVVCLTKTQMAAALQISVRSLNGMMSRGDIAFFRIGRRLVRFRIEEALKRMSERVLVTAKGEE